MKKSNSLILLLFLSINLFAQDIKFEVSVSTDSVLMDNYFELSFQLENVSGNNFSAPTFEDFDVVGGPNQSMMTSYVNGAMSQSLSYTYYLKPKDIGNYFIGPASIETEDGVLETQPIEILVVPNPDGIIQQPERTQRRSFQWFSTPEDIRPEPTPKQKARKKRKVYRM